MRRTRTAAENHHHPHFSSPLSRLLEEAITTQMADVSVEKYVPSADEEKAEAERQKHQKRSLEQASSHLLDSANPIDPIFDSNPPVTLPLERFRLPPTILTQLRPCSGYLEGDVLFSYQRPEGLRVGVGLKDSLVLLVEREGETHHWVTRVRSLHEFCTYPSCLLDRKLEGFHCFDPKRFEWMAEGKRKLFARLHRHEDLTSSILLQFNQSQNPFTFFWPSDSNPSLAFVHWLFHAEWPTPDSFPLDCPPLDDQTRARLPPPPSSPCGGRFSFASMLPAILSSPPESPSPSVSSSSSSPSSSSFSSFSPSTAPSPLTLGLGLGAGVAGLALGGPLLALGAVGAAAAYFSYSS